MKVAAILGVGPGLGAAIARRFAGEGFAAGPAFPGLAEVIDASTARVANPGTSEEEQQSEAFLAEG